MPQRLSIVLLFGLAAMLVPKAQSQNPPAKRIAVSIDAGKTAPPISPYMYGQFIEHIGPLINRAYGPRCSTTGNFTRRSTPNRRSRAAGRGGRGPGRGRPASKWRPIGPDEFVAMDRQKAYVGVHTPLIRPAAGEPRGIRQAGLALRQGKAYTGRVVVAGARGAKVTVSLVWGAGPGDRQVLPITGLAASYAKFPLKFTAGADNNDGRIEISGTGQGSFHVGAVSLMPADNIRGFRPDTTGLLKQLRSGMYRWPGGNYLSGHEWRDAIGDPDQRPPRRDPDRGGFQPNDVGTDEFMVLMELLGVDPFISVNSGFGDAWSAGRRSQRRRAQAPAAIGPGKDRSRG